MVKVEIIQMSNGNSYYMEFKDYNEMINYMKEIYYEWIIAFDYNPITLYIYDDYFE